MLLLLLVFQLVLRYISVNRRLLVYQLVLTALMLRRLLFYQLVFRYISVNRETCIGLSISSIMYTC